MKSAAEGNRLVCLKCGKIADDMIQFEFACRKTVMEIPVKKLIIENDVVIEVVE